MKRMSLILTLSPPDELIEALKHLNDEGGQEKFLAEFNRLHLTATGFYAVVHNGVSANYNDTRLLELAGEYRATTAEVVNSVDTHLCKTLMIETFAAMNANEATTTLQSAQSVIQH